MKIDPRDEVPLPGDWHKPGGAFFEAPKRGLATAGGILKLFVLTIKTMRTKHSAESEHLAQNDLCEERV